MSYFSKDEMLLGKIIKYLAKVRLLYKNIQHLNAKDIDDGIDGLALT